MELLLQMCRGHVSSCWKPSLGSQQGAAQTDIQGAQYDWALSLLAFIYFPFVFSSLQQFSIQKWAYPIISHLCKKNFPFYNKNLCLWGPGPKDPEWECRFAGH